MKSQLFSLALLFSAIFGLVVTLPAPENDPDADEVPDRIMVNLEEVSFELYANGSEKMQGIEDLMEVARMKMNGSRNPDLKTEGRKPDEDRARRYIFGADNREDIINQYVYPWCAIGQLANGCTAAFIGPYHAITAAHCVYDISTSSWRPSWHLNIKRRRNCNSYGDSMTWTNVHITVGYAYFHKHEYDYALIIYDSSDPATCYMGMGYYDPWPNVGFSVTGYPADKRASELPGCWYDSMWSSTCSSSTTAHDGLTLVYTCDTVLPGMNGAPIHRQQIGTFAGDQVVYGVNAYQSIYGNFGPRIDQDRFYQIVDWMRASGYYPTVN